MREAALKKKMAAHIRERGGWARSIPGGPMSAGMPDLMFFYRSYGGGLEVKLPGKENTLTPLQEQTLRSIRAGGGIAKMVTDVRQVDAILNTIDKAQNRKNK